MPCDSDERSTVAVRDSLLLNVDVELANKADPDPKRHPAGQVGGARRPGG